MPCWGTAGPWKHSLAFMPQDWWTWQIKWMKSVSMGSYQYKNQMKGGFFACLWVILLYFSLESRLIPAVLGLVQSFQQSPRYMYAIKCNEITPGVLISHCTMTPMQYHSERIFSISIRLRCHIFSCKKLNSIPECYLSDCLFSLHDIWELLCKEWWAPRVLLHNFPKYPHPHPLPKSAMITMFITYHLHL